MNSASRVYRHNWEIVARLVTCFAFYSAAACDGPGGKGENRTMMPSEDASAAPSLTYGAPGTSSDVQQKGDTDNLVSACIRTIDDKPDELHAEMTPSVRCLIEIGPRATPRLIELLDAPDVGTRLHAVTAIRAISRLEFGFDGKQWGNDGQARWTEWWTSVGYDVRAEPTKRAEAIRKIRARLLLASVPAPP
jgi:hypothetical protein